MKYLEIKKMIKQCQGCVYCVEGEQNLICSNFGMKGSIGIENLDEINDNCPLPDLSQSMIDTINGMIK